MANNMKPLVSNGLWLLVVVGMGVFAWRMTAPDDLSLPEIPDVSQVVQLPSFGREEISGVVMKEDRDAQSYGAYQRQISTFELDEQTLIYGLLQSWDWESGQMVLDVGEETVTLSADGNGVMDGLGDGGAMVSENQVASYIDEPVTLRVRDVAGGGLVVDQIAVTIYE